MCFGCFREEDRGRALRSKTTSNKSRILTSDLTLPDYDTSMSVVGVEVNPPYNTEDGVHKTQEEV